MMNPEREPLSGTIGIDETSIVHLESNDTRDISNNNPITAGAVEAIDGNTFGCIRLKNSDSKELSELEPLTMENTQPSLTVVTDGNPFYVDPAEQDHLVKKPKQEKRLARTH